MKYYDPKLHGRLRGLIRREVRARQDWRREARRNRSRWWRRDAGPVFRGIIPAGFIGLAFGDPGGPALWVALAAWTAHFAALRVSQYQQHGRAIRSAPVYSLYPFEPRELVDDGVEQVLRSSIWVLIDVAAALWGSFLARGVPVAGWSARIAGDFPPSGFRCSPR